MKKIKALYYRLAHSTQAKVIAAVAFVTTLVLGSNVSAYATGTPDPVTSAFSSLQSKLVAYLGLGVAMVIALIGLAVGVRMLVKWVKRASASA